MGQETEYTIAALDALFPSVLQATPAGTMQVMKHLFNRQPPSHQPDDSGELLTSENVQTGWCWIPGKENYS